MLELTSMENIGKNISRKLLAIGISSLEILDQKGTQHAFRKRKGMHPEVCLVHLYVLQGAIENVDFNCLSKQMKDELKEFSDSLK